MSCKRFKFLGQSSLQYVPHHYVYCLRCQNKENPRKLQVSFTTLVLFLSLPLSPNGETNDPKKTIIEENDLFSPFPPSISVNPNSSGSRCIQPALFGWHLFRSFLVQEITLRWVLSSSLPSILSQCYHLMYYFIHSFRFYTSIYFILYKNLRN